MSNFVTYQVFTWAVGLILTFNIGLFLFMWKNLSAQIQQININLNETLLRVEKALKHDIGNHRTDISTLHSRIDDFIATQHEKWATHDRESTEWRERLSDEIDSKIESEKIHARNNRNAMSEGLKVIMDNKILEHQKSCRPPLGETQTIRRV